MSQMHLWEEHESGYLSFWYISPSKTVTTTTIEDVVRRIVSLKLWNWSSSSLVSGFGSTSAFNRNRTGLRDCRRSKENHISQGTIKREKEWARGNCTFPCLRHVFCKAWKPPSFEAPASYFKRSYDLITHGRRKKSKSDFVAEVFFVLIDWLIKV